MPIEVPGERDRSVARDDRFALPVRSRSARLAGGQPQRRDRRSDQVICQVAASNYVGMYGRVSRDPTAKGSTYRNSAVAIRDILDGPSLTIAIGERSHRLGEATWVGAVTNALLFPDDGDSIGRYRLETSPGMVLDTRAKASALETQGPT